MGPDATMDWFHMAPRLFLPLLPLRCTRNAMGWCWTVWFYFLKVWLDPHHEMFLSISPLERKTVPSFSQSSVPSLPASLASVESKRSAPQSPPRSPVKSPLEVRLYPQPYFQTRTQHQAQQLKKIEPPLQSPVKLKPKVVSTALVRFI